MYKMRLSYTVIVVLSTLKCYANMHVTIEEKIKLSKEVQKYFYAGCIYFVSTAGFRDLVPITRMIELVNTEDLMIGLLSFPDERNPFKSLKCQRKKPLFIIPFTNKETKKHLEKSSSMANLSRGVWLLFLEELQIEEFFDGVDIPFDCEFLVAQPSDEQIVLTEVYRVGPSLPLQKNHFGCWTYTSGLDGPIIGFYRRRSNLLGMELETGFKKSKRMDASIEEMKRKSPSGFMGEIWDLLEYDMNFTTEYHTPKDDAFGGKTSNGSWTGVIGMLQRREIHVTNVVFVMTSNRMEAVDFTVPLLNIRTYLIIREWGTYDQKWFAFFIPFSSRLWVSLLVAVFLIAFTLGTTYRLGFRYANFDRKDLRYSTAAFLALGIFCLQGHSLSPKSASMRMMFVTSYLTAVILLASYSAAFITHLTLRESQLPFSDFNEFFEDNLYHLGMMPNSAQLDYFKEAKVNLLKQIYKKKIEPYLKSLPSSDVEGLQRLCNQKHYAHLTSTYNLMQNGAPEKCDIILVPRAFFPGSIAITTAKHSHYLGLFNQKLQTMRRVGLLSGVFKRYSYKLNHIPETAKPNSIDLLEVLPIFSILGAGALLSLVIIWVEIYIIRLSERLKYAQNMRRKKRVLVKENVVTNTMGRFKALSSFN